MIDEEFSNSALEEARKLFAGTCDFVLGVAGLKQLPEGDRPEIAFAGRSNVGKSSLLNALTGRKALARTSHTPGRTQQLNFFNLGDDLLYLVDMPGYGYAKVSKSERKEWDSLIRSYLRGRATLRCVFILVDSRHGLKDSDIEIMKMLDETAVSYRIVLTKTDKVKREELAQTVDKTKAVIKKNPAAYPDILQTSSHKNMGVDVLQATVIRVCS